MRARSRRRAGGPGGRRLALHAPAPRGVRPPGPGPAPPDRGGRVQGVRTAIPKISLATVYKALEALVASGLTTKLAAGDGSARYDARSDHHYHVRCLRSGAVRDLPTPFDPDLIAKIDPGLLEQLERQGFRMTGYRLELVGYFEPGGSTPAHAAGDAPAAT